MELIDQCLIFGLMPLPERMYSRCLIELLQQRDDAQHASGVGSQISFRNRGREVRRRPQLQRERKIGRYVILFAGNLVIRSEMMPSTRPASGARSASGIAGEKSGGGPNSSASER